MSDRWYYQLLLEEFGPVSGDQVLQLITIGTLSEGDLVRNEAGGEWMLISAMKAAHQTSESSRSTLEEIQDLSELNFRFENSSIVTNRATVSGNLEQSSPTQPTVAAKATAAERDRKATLRTKTTSVRKSVAAPAKSNNRAASQQQESVVPKEKRKRVAGAKTTSNVSREKRQSNSVAAANDELSDDVFTDVFEQKDTSSQRPRSATASMSTSPTVAGFPATAANSVAITSPQLMTSPGQYSSMPNSSSSPGRSLYQPTSVSTTTPPRSAYKPPVKKSVSVSEPKDWKKIGTVGGAVSVIAGVLAISIFGSPFGSAPPESPFDPKATAAVLTTIFNNFNDLTMTTDESAFGECMDNVKPQMAAILVTTQDPKNDTPEAAACQAATKALMKIADSFPDQQEEIEQGVIEFQKQIALVQ